MTLSPAIFPVFFLVFWLATTTLLSFLSGWFRLMRRYPDRPEPAVCTLTRQSGLMGVGVRMNGLLTLSACASGLRVHTMRIFGPFSRNFFVPWEDVAVLRKQSWISGPVAELQFGPGMIGRLIVQAYVANRLARSLPRRWPEAGPVPAEMPSQIFWRHARTWLVLVVLASVFFIAISRIVPHGPVFPPVIAMVLLSSIVFAVGLSLQLARELKALRDNAA